MTDPILEEVYAARRRLWKLGGGTIAGVCAYLREHPVSDALRPAAPASKLPRAATRVRPPRAATRKKAARQ